MAGSRDVSLVIFITSVSGSESLLSFTNCFFHLSRPPGFRIVFDAVKKNGEFGRIQCQSGKESSSRGKRKRLIFIHSGTVEVKVQGKIIPVSFLKIEGRERLIGQKLEKEGQLEEMVGDQNSSPKALPGAGKGKRGGGKGNARGGMM